MASYDVAVIGLGAMGAACLHALGQRGRRVIGFDRYEPGHDRGSSHGESRIIRTAYFEGSAYVPLVRLAYDGWRRLEEGGGERILTRTGIVEAGVAGSEMVAGSLLSAQAYDIPHEVLLPSQVADRFPAFAFPADWDCLFQADGGVLEPEKAVRLFLASAKGAGATIHANARVRRVVPEGDCVVVELQTGQTIEAASAVIAAGPWIGELVPELGRRLTLTRQTQTWFEPVDAAYVKPERMPAFLFDTGDAVTYGLPDICGNGVKAGFHGPEGVLDGPDDPRRPASHDEMAAVRDILKRYVPAAAGAPRRSTACIYTRTPDEDFVLGLHPDAPQIVLASPCSGHGFKFAPVIGEILADLAIARTTDKPIDLFRPERLLH